MGFSLYDLSFVENSYWERIQLANNRAELLQIETFVLRTAYKLANSKRFPPFKVPFLTKARLFIAK